MGEGAKGKEMEGEVREVGETRGIVGGEVTTKP